MFHTQDTTPLSDEVRRFLLKGNSASLDAAEEAEREDADPTKAHRLSVEAVDCFHVASKIHDGTLSSGSTTEDEGDSQMDPAVLTYEIPGGIGFGSSGTGEVEPIRVWRFADSPEHLRDLSDHGG